MSFVLVVGTGEEVFDGFGGEFLAMWADRGF